MKYMNKFVFCCIPLYCFVHLKSYQIYTACGKTTYLSDSYGECNHYLWKETPDYIELRSKLPLDIDDSKIIVNIDKYAIGISIPEKEITITNGELLVKKLNILG